MPEKESDWFVGLNETVKHLGGPTSKKARHLMHLLAESKCLAPQSCQIIAPIAGEHPEDLRDPLNFIEMVIEPVARELGVAWTEDALTFVDVTLLSYQLQELLYLHEEQFGKRTAFSHTAKSAVLTIADGKQHRLGLACVAYLMREAGWLVDIVDFNEAEYRLGDQHYDMLCISVGHTDLLEELANKISRFRAASKHPELIVALGGPGVLSGSRNMVTNADIVAAGVPELLWRLRENRSK